MTEEIKIALIVAIAPTMAALASLLVSVRNNKKADTIIEKADEIHTLTNSNLTSVKEALLVANTKIEGLEKTIKKLR